MTTARSKEVAEAQLRTLMNDRIKAVRAKDVKGLMSNHAPDVLAFDVINPLQYVGSDMVRKRAEEWFSSFQGPLGFEIRDLSITTGDDVAFCHSLNGVSGTMTDGNKIDMWWRATVCFRKQITSGWSRMSIARCHSTRRAVERRSISGHSPSRIDAGLSFKLTD